MTRLVVLSAGIVIALSLAAGPAGAAEGTPTYNEHVGEILLDNCASCHRPNQVAPMSLLTYRDARPWARAIKAKVASPARCRPGSQTRGSASSRTTRV